MIESERILNILYNNYLKECAENKYKIPDLQNRLKTLISFQESTNVKRRESVNNYKNNYFKKFNLLQYFFFKISGDTSRTTEDSPRRIGRSRRNMLHRSNTIYMCPTSTVNHNTPNLILPRENRERIPSIAIPLIEMGFSARLVERAIAALGIN